MFNRQGKLYIYKGIFSALCAAITIAILFFYSVDTASAFNAKSWPIVEAKVIESIPMKGCGRGSSYYPKVIYQYTIDQNVYVSERIYFGSSGCGSQSRAIEITNRYPVGEKVSAHYNVTSPMESVLVVGTVLWDTWFMLIVMAIFVLFMIFTFVYWFKKAKSNWLVNEII